MKIIKSFGRLSLRFLVPLLLLMGSIGLSVTLTEYITETYFFDRLLYYKSNKYGYWKPDKNQTYDVFGRRSNDIQKLIYNYNEPIFLQDTPDIFTVVVIGDSYVWGQGIKNTDRFAYILEKKLNNIIPSRIISLGNPGDSALGNYAKYIRYRKTSSADLYIFGLVDNDLFYSDDPAYYPELTNSILESCPQKPIYIPPQWSANTAQLYPYSTSVAESYSDTYRNKCVLNILAQLFPQKNSLYISFTSFLETYDNETYKYLREYMSIFEKAGLTVIDTLPYYKQNYSLHELEKFFVSKGERHMSKLANKMFAELLFKEIQSRGFVN